MNPSFRFLTFALLAPIAACAVGQKIEPFDAFRIECPVGAVESRIVVDQLGTAHLPMAGPLVLAGLSLSDAEARVGERLSDLLSLPLGSFRLIPAANPFAPIRYFGAVRFSGSTFATSGLKLSDVLARADPKPSADLDQIEIRNFNGTIRVAAKPFGNPNAWDCMLRPGDRIYVPERTGGIQVFVLGSVERPGALDFQRGMTVRGALRLVGGPRVEGDATRVEVHRRQALLGMLDVSLSDAPLEPGDAIHVPKRADAGYIYVVGGVMRPNRYAIRPGMKLLEAIEAAGGLRPESAALRPVLVRTESGRSVRRVIDLAAIRAKTMPDIELKAGDLIDVPEPGR